MGSSTTHLCFPSSTTLWSPPPLLLLLLATPVLATMALATTTARGRLRLTPLSFLELSPTLLPLCSLLSMPSLPLVLWLTPLSSRLSLRLLLRSPMRSLPTTFPLLSATTATAATPTTDKLLTLDGVRRSLNQFAIDSYCLEILTWCYTALTTITVVAVVCSVPIFMKLCRNKG